MKKLILHLIILTCFILSASGQNEDMFIPSELKQLTAVTEPATLYRGFLKVGIDWQYAGFKRIFDENSNKYFVPGSTIARSSALNLSTHYGITDKLQLNLDIPYMLDMVQSTILLDDPLFRAREQFDFQQKGYGLGDISTGLYVQLVKEQENVPSITLRTTAILPTGRKNPSNFSSDSLIFDMSTGSGETSVAVDIQARKILYPYSFTFYSGFDMGFGGNRVINPGEPEKSFRSGNIYYVAGGFNFHLNDWICMTNDLYFTHIGPETLQDITGDETKWQVNLIPYLHFQVQQLRLVQGMFLPLMGKLTSAEPSYVFIIQYIF
ncbi:MAG: transporter [Bacteroidales bacterium]